MEVALALGFVVAVFLAVSAWTSRNVERSRAARYVGELHSLRRAGPGGGRPGDEPGGVASSGRSASYKAVPPPPVDLDALLRSVENVHGPLEAALESLREPAQAEAPPADQNADVLRRERAALDSSIDSMEGTVASLLAAAGAPRPGPVEPPERQPAELEVPELGPAAGLALTVSDESRRLVTDLEIVARSTERVAHAARTTAISAGAVERGAEALAPFGPALSGLADRINLLALNVALRTSTPGEEPGAGPLEEAAQELRGLFDETRRLSREVGSLTQRASDAARAARESSSEVVVTAESGRTQSERSLLHVRTLAGETVRLSAALEAARRVEAGAVEIRERLRKERSAGVAREDALLAALESERRASAAWRASLESLPAALAGLHASIARALPAEPAAGRPPQPVQGIDPVPLLARLRAAENALAELIHQLGAVRSETGAP